jgi:hypothetical protein
VATGDNSAGTALAHFEPADVVILPIVTIALIIKTIARSAWTVLKQVIDLLFPILLQLIRFPLFTLRILGDGIAAVLAGVVRILPIGAEGRAAWRDVVRKRWAWLRQKISYKAFEEAVHHLFENGMAWVFRKCKALSPTTALLVILGAVLWIPISFGAATLMHAVLLAKAASLPAWLQLLHPVATIIAKTKLLVLPVYPAAWPQAKQHSLVQAIIGFSRYLATLHLIQKTRYRYLRMDQAAAAAIRYVASFIDHKTVLGSLLTRLDTAAAMTGRKLRNTAAGLLGLLAAIPLLGKIVRHYADHYDRANQQPAGLLTERVKGFYARWSIKFSAEYYDARGREQE